MRQEIKIKDSGIWAIWFQLCCITLILATLPRALENDSPKCGIRMYESASQTSLSTTTYYTVNTCNQVDFDYQSLTK